MRDHLDHIDGDTATGDKSDTRPPEAPLMMPRQELTRRRADVVPAVLRALFGRQAA